MGYHEHIAAIEEILKRIPALEQELADADCPNRRKCLMRSLKSQEKRLEHLIPYQHRRALQRMCEPMGISGDFF